MNWPKSSSTNELPNSPADRSNKQNTQHQDEEISEGEIQPFPRGGKPRHMASEEKKLNKLSTWCDRHLLPSHEALPCIPVSVSSFVSDIWSVFGTRLSWKGADRRGSERGIPVWSALSDAGCSNRRAPEGKKNKNK